MANKTINSGNHNEGGIQNNGNGTLSVININDINHQITQTDMYELLGIVSDLELRDDGEYLLGDPAELDTKLIFNNAVKYSELFSIYSVQLIPIDDVMEEFSNSSKIIMKLNRLFVEQAEYDDKGNRVVGDGDDQLRIIEEQLKGLIKSDMRFQKSPISEEVLDQFVIVLLAYGVSKCKILINPNDKK